MLTSAVCRQMLFFISRSLDMEFDPAPGVKVGGEISQSFLSLRVPVAALMGDLDNFTEEYIIPAVAPFLAKLISHGAEVCYELPLPRDMICCRHLFDGMSLRAIFTPVFSDPVLGDVFVPKSDWSKYDPSGYEIRFDMLHSRRRALAA